MASTIRSDATTCKVLALLDKDRTAEAGKASFRGFALEQHITVLMHHISWSESVPHRARRSILRDALFAHEISSPLSPSSLASALASAQSRFLRRPIADYWIRGTVSLANLPSVQRGKIADCSYSISSQALSITPQENKIYERFASSAGIKTMPRGYATVWIRARGRTGYDAALQALDAFSTLRGIWNYVVIRRNFRMSFGVAKPINRIVSGPIHFICDAAKRPIDNEWVYNPDYRAPIEAFDVSRRWAAVRQAEADVRNRLRGRWYRPLVEDCFRRYATALDEDRLNVSFLRLWGILESLTLTSKQRAEDTNHRAASAFKDAWYVEDLLRSMRNERNEFVHADREPDGSEQLAYQLKSVVEGVFEFWLRVGSKLHSTEEASTFLSLPHDIGTLKSNRRILEEVLRYRGS